MVWGVLLLGFLVEMLIVLLSVLYDEVEVVIEFNNLEEWVIFGSDELGLVREDSIGVAALYSYGS